MEQLKHITTFLLPSIGTFITIWKALKEAKKDNHFNNIDSLNQIDLITKDEDLKNKCLELKLKLHKLNFLQIPNRSINTNLLDHLFNNYTPYQARLIYNSIEFKDGKAEIKKSEILHSRTNLFFNITMISLSVVGVFISTYLLSLYPNDETSKTNLIGFIGAIPLLIFTAFILAKEAIDISNRLKLLKVINS